MALMSGWHILVVEGDPDEQAVMSAMMADFEIIVDMAGNAAEALRHLHQVSYTAVLIDLGLPQGESRELLAAIRRSPATAYMPCIAITASHTARIRRDALQAGFDAYLLKPIDDLSFVRELDRVIALTI